MPKVIIEISAYESIKQILCPSSNTPKMNLQFKCISWNYSLGYFLLFYLFPSLIQECPSSLGQLCYGARFLMAWKSLLLEDCPSSVPQAGQTVEDGCGCQNARVRHSSMLSQLWQVSLCDGLWDLSACHPAFSIFHVACYLLLKWEEKTD